MQEPGVHHPDHAKDYVQQAGEAQYCCNCHTLIAGNNPFCGCMPEQRNLIRVSTKGLLHCDSCKMVVDPKREHCRCKEISPYRQADLVAHTKPLQDYFRRHHPSPERGNQIAAQAS